MLTRTALSGIVVLCGLLLSDTRAEAASYQHIDQLAICLQNNVARLHQEIGLHYPHSPHLPHLLADTRDMYAMARHIHELAHYQGSLTHMASDLRTLDRAFHHLEELVCVIDRGHLGHFPGRASHVQELLSLIGNDIHHLRSDIETLLAVHHGFHGGHSGHVIGYPIPSRRVITTVPQRNFGEIRSGWTRTLSDISGGSSDIRRRFR